MPGSQRGCVQVHNLESKGGGGVVERAQVLAPELAVRSGPRPQSEVGEPNLVNSTDSDERLTEARVR